MLPQADAAEPAVDWLFLDLNSYFASVEQQERAELRGRPVAVAPVEAETTCCIAASYEAKACGVKTGTQIAAARRLCPHIEIVEARPKLYVEYHHKIVEVVSRCLPVTCVMSVDEMGCRLLGRERAVSNATRLGLDMKQAIRGVGETLRCSIGLAPNRYLAKLASDMMKPDGLTVLLARDLPQALFRLQLRDLVGISTAMERRLRAHGIATVEQLCRLTPPQMRQAWGSIVGERMWHWLRGADFGDPPRERQTLGKQHVLAPELRTPEKAFQVMQKLLQNTAANLRKHNLWAGGLGVFVEFVRSRYGAERESAIEPWKAQARIDECRDTFTLQKHLSALWSGCPQHTPLQVGVWLFNLVPNEQHTMSLFEADDRQYRLSTAMDALNDRYGHGAVYFANVGTIRDAAPTRIAFTSVPDLKEF